MSNIFDSMLSKEGNGQTLPDDTLESLAEQTLAETNSLTSSNEGSTPADVKEVTQELLRHGYIDEARKSGLFQKAMIHSDAVGDALEPLDLKLQLDEHRGVAFLKVKTNQNDEAGQEWSHPLVRRRRLTLEQSILVAILRQAFIAHEQEAGVGQTVARVAVEDLLQQFLIYFDDSGSDARNESRLLSLLDQLKTHGIISEVDKRQEVAIRPLIAHLADPASLNSLLQTLQDQAEAVEPKGENDGQ